MITVIMLSMCAAGADAFVVKGDDSYSFVSMMGIDAVKIEQQRCM